MEADNSQFMSRETVDLLNKFELIKKQRQHQFKKMTSKPDEDDYQKQKIDAYIRTESVKIIDRQPLKIQKSSKKSSIRRSVKQIDPQSSEKKHYNKPLQIKSQNISNDKEKTVNFQKSPEKQIKEFEIPQIQKCFEHSYQNSDVEIELEPNQNLNDQSFGEKNNDLDPVQDAQPQNQEKKVSAEFPKPDQNIQEQKVQNNQTESKNHNSETLIHQRVHKNTLYYQDLYDYVTEIKQSSKQESPNVQLNQLGLFKYQNLVKNQNQEQDPQIQDKINPLVNENLKNEFMQVLESGDSEQIQKLLKYMVLAQLKESEISDMIQNFLENQDGDHQQETYQESIKKFVDDSISQASKNIQENYKLNGVSNISRQFTFNQKGNKELNSKKLSNKSPSQKQQKQKQVDNKKNNISNKQMELNKQKDQIKNIIQKNKNHIKKSNQKRQSEMKVDQHFMIQKAPTYKSLDNSLRMDVQNSKTNNPNEQNKILDYNMEHFFKKEQILSEIDDIDAQINELNNELKNKKFSKQMNKQSGNKKSSTQLQTIKSSPVENITIESMNPKKKGQKLDFTDFTERNNNWIKQKQIKQQQRQLNIREQELKNCSFNPQINRNLQKIDLKEQKIIAYQESKDFLSPIIKQNIKPKESIKILDFQANPVVASRKSKIAQKKETNDLLSILHNLTVALSNNPSTIQEKSAMPDNKSIKISNFDQDYNPLLDSCKYLTLESRKLKNNNVQAFKIN